MLTTAGAAATAAIGAVNTGSWGAMSARSVLWHARIDGCDGESFWWSGQ